MLWVRSYTTFDDLDKITASRASGDYTQHYIRLGSNNGRFLFTRRDIIFPSYHPTLANVISTWKGENGVHFKHNPPFDLNKSFSKQPNDRSWEAQFSGVQFRRLITDRCAKIFT
jgi:hypothetical protein